MSDSIHVDAATAGGDSWVELDFSDHAYIYVSFEIYVAAAQMIDWRTQSRGGPSNLLLLAGTATTGNSGAEVEAINLRDHVNGQPTYDSWQTDTFSDLIGGVAGGNWHVLQLVFDSGAANGSSLDADGTSVTGTNANSTASHVLLGLANTFAGGGGIHRGELWLGEILVGTTLGGSDLLNFNPSLASDLTDFSDTFGTVTLATAPTPPPSYVAPVVGVGTGGVRIAVAFDDPTLEETPTWTYLTATENLTAGYSIDRGRQFEFDKVDTGTATISINDVDGVLDPTNASGPYYGTLDPLLQVQIELFNPVTETYKVRYRGFIEDFNYVIDPSQVVTRLEINCVDLFEIVTAIEMQADGGSPPAFGDIPPAGSEGQIFFDNASAKDRIEQVLGNAGIPTGFYTVFSLNVDMQESTYAPSQNVLEVVQDAADAEFPTVSNVYCDRLGRFAVHGRLAKFDPTTTAASASPGAWNFTHWKAGDGDAVLASISDTAQIRTLAFNRGVSMIRNSCMCYPQGILDSDIPGQLATDSTSIGQFGFRSWSAENLLIGSLTGSPLTTAGAGTLTGNTALEETRQYAVFIKQRYKTPRDRITDITFRSMDPDDPRAAANWDLLTGCDISDLIDVTETSPGGGGFTGDTWFIEGVHEEVQPGNGTYADVTLSLDLSPGDIFIGHGSGTGYTLDS